MSGKKSKIAMDGKGRIVRAIICSIASVALCISANCFLPISATGRLYYIPIAVVLFILANTLPIFSGCNIPSVRLGVCSHGVICLKAFLASCCFSVAYHIVLLFVLLPTGWKTLLWSAVVCIIVHTLIFFNGIICVYLSSVQMGVVLRIVGAVFGMIPIVNLFVLHKIIRTVSDEVEYESAKMAINQQRAEQKICATKYPILLVHGVCFRDYKYFNYWGRIPAELERNGAEVYYGKQHSAASIADNAAELTARIKQIIEETGCEKVNIIAHSKGGLDCRYAVSFCGAAPYIASLTTINTPHRGCEYADYLFGRISQKTQNRVASAYDSAMRRLGDSNPDFLAAMRDLTAASCRQLNEKMPDNSFDGIYCQSFGSKLNGALVSYSPLAFAYPLVRHFDGENDGLVSVDSFAWGESYHLITTNDRCGVSHGDIIDLGRRNLAQFDVREFYVHIVSALRQRGL